MGILKGYVIKASGWQVFSVFMLAVLFFGIVPDELYLLKSISSIVLVVVIFGWFLVTGLSLNENLPEGQQESDTLFVISCFYGILLVSTSVILRDTYLGEELMPYAIIATVTFVVATFYMIYFTSIQFVSNQEHFLRNDKLSAEATFTLFIMFLFGVLILQSRIRRFFSEP